MIFPAQAGIFYVCGSCSVRPDKLEFVGEGKGIREKGKGNARERQNL